MPQFGTTSMARVHECHPLLQKVLEKAIQNGPDFTVIWGHRGQHDQERMFSEGTSKAHFGESPHNTVPSNAFDVAPWPIDWDNINRFRVLAGYILGVADAMGVPLRWGGDWDRDFSELDERGLRDFGHFELTLK